jgi:hypothetical protein
MRLGTAVRWLGRPVMPPGAGLMRPGPAVMRLGEPVMQPGTALMWFGRPLMRFGMALMWPVMALMWFGEALMCAPSAFPDAIYAKTANLGLGTRDFHAFPCRRWAKRANRAGGLPLNPPTITCECQSSGETTRATLRGQDQKPFLTRVRNPCQCCVYARTPETSRARKSVEPPNLRNRSRGTQRRGQRTSRVKLRPKQTYIDEPVRRAHPGD